MLHLGIGHVHLRIIKYLIGKGADIKENTNKGENILNLAVQGGHPKLFIYLRNKGVNKKETACHI